MKERYKLTIEPLTPVHIGTGKKITPLDYKIVQTKNGSRYARYSSDSILYRIAQCSEKSREFESIANLSDMKMIQKFFHKNFSSDDITYLCKMTNIFEDKYEKNINLDPLQNACEVDELYRPVENRYAVIPGSSIKGAIRTALLDMCRDISNNFDFQKAKKNKFFENELFDKSDAKNDPMRCISVSDCMLYNNKIQTVGSLQIVDCKEGFLFEKNNSQIFAEVISGKLMSETFSEEFIISLDKDLQNSINLKDNRKMIKKSFSMKDIQTECNYFYGEGFNLEFNHFYKNEHSDKYELIYNLKNQIDRITKEENSFVIRLGRWSQFEFVTLYDENKKKGGTRTLFDYNGQYLPMGWCKCTIEKI